MKKCHTYRPGKKAIHSEIGLTSSGLCPPYGGGRDHKKVVKIANHVAHSLQRPRNARSVFTRNGNLPQLYF